MKFEGDNGKMIFLDDNKSFLPRVCDASVKSVAKFVAQDSIFTAKGFNTGYKKQYIARHGGYYHNAKEIKYDAEGLLVRDKTKPASLIEDKISQDDHIIGYVQRLRSNTSDNYELRVVNDKNEIICRALYSWNTSMPVNDTYNVNLVMPKTGQESSLKVNGVRKIDQELINHLIAKNLL